MILDAAEPQRFDFPRCGAAAGRLDSGLLVQYAVTGVLTMIPLVTDTFEAEDIGLGPVAAARHLRGSIYFVAEVRTSPTTIASNWLSTARFAAIKKRKCCSASPQQVCRRIPIEIIKAQIT
jgi:hypothetical protein